MTPTEQPPIDALNAPLPPTFAERVRRRKTPLLSIFFGSAVLHALFLGFVMSNQPATPPAERLMEIDLREPKPAKKPEKKVEKEKPKPLKIVKRVPPKTARIQPKTEKPRQVAPPKPQPKIAKIEKPIPPPKKSAPSKKLDPPKKSAPPVQPKVAIKPPEKIVPPVQPKVAIKPPEKTKPRVAMQPKNPAKPDPLPSKPQEPKRATQDKAAPPELPKSLRIGALPKPLGDAGKSKGPGRPHADNEAAPAPGSSGEKSAMKSKAPTRTTHGSSPFDEPNVNQPKTGGKNSGEETPLPRGERTGRLAAGLNSSDPTFDRSSPNRRPGGRSAGANFGSPGNGAPRSRNDDLAGTDGAGGARSPGAMAKAGGRPRPGSNIMAYRDPTNRDRDRVAVGPGAFGPGKTGGNGAGNRRGGGAGRDDGEFNRSTFNARPGNGLGGGNGGDIGGSPRRGRGGDEMAGGGGGNGGGVGGGNGKGVGAGNGGGGAGRGRGPRVAGNLFGDPNGSKGGDARGGGGKGGGPGGPGNGTRLARRGDDGNGGNGNGSGDGPSFGRGGRGNGAGAGFGSGDKGNGSGDKGARDGRGDRPGDVAGGGGGKGSGGRRPGMASASREREGEDLIGRGVWGSWTAKFYQDKSDHPDTPDATFGPGHEIDWPLFTDLKATKKYKTLDFNWGNDPPAGGMKSTFWSARITGKIFVPKDDDYWFYFDQLDDAGRLVLDGDEVIKVWKVQKSTPDSGKIHLKRGEHEIAIEYVQGPAVEASLTLSWKSSSFPKEVVGIYRSGG